MNRKIDIYLLNRTLTAKTGRAVWTYETSTNRARTCREAKDVYLKTIGRGLDAGQVKANFDHDIDKIPS